MRSARSLFGVHGYKGTNMRVVAADAAVSEALLYRYFPSKADLFEAAVIAPYHGFVEAFLDGWSGRDTQAPNDEMIAEFVSGLFAFVNDNRDVLFALAAANRFGEVDAGATGALSQEIRRLADFTAGEARQRGLEHVDLDMAVTCSVALVFSMGLLDDLLFSAGERPDDARILEQMTRYAVAGVQQRS